MNRVSQALIAFLYLDVALVALGTLCWPLARDHGIFAWVGDVILRGGVPYRDAWEVKGILTYYTFALSQLLFGRTLWGIRAIDLLFLAAACFVLAKFLRRYCEAWVIQIGIAFFALFHMHRGYWATAQPDGWAAMLVMCAGAVLMTPGVPTKQKRILAGALIGLASLYKIVFLAFLAPAAVSCLRKDSGPLDLRIEKFLPVVVGAGAVVLASMAWLWAFGALGEFAEIQFKFNTSIHSSIFSRSFKGVMRRFTAYLSWYVWAAPLIAAGFVTLWVKHRDVFYALLVQLLAAFAIVALQNKFYSYHWHAVRFTLLLIFVFGISGTWQLLSRRLAMGDENRAAILRMAMVASLCALAIFNGPKIDRQGISARMLGNEPVKEYYRQFKSYYNKSFRFLSNHRVVEYLLAHSNPNESVLVWAFEPMINYMADRRSPTRFGYNYPLVITTARDKEYGYRDEFMQALGKDLPRYIVVGVGDHNSLMRRSSKVAIEAFPRLRALMKQRYELEAELKGFEMWRRVDKPQPRRGRTPKGPHRRGRSVRGEA